MALIVLTSAAGSPGVTSTAVGLTLAWHRSAILVDADPGAFQAVLAGYLRGQLPTEKGLQRVAEAHRDRRRLVEVISDETVPLTDQPVAGAVEPAAQADAADHSTAASSRRLLPGFVRPANAALFSSVWADLADALVDYGRAGIDVLLDAGRMDAQGLPQPLVDRADLVALMLASDLRSVAAARNAATTLRERSAGEPNLGLILRGENQPYGRREIARQLGLPAVSVIADDPESARVFSDGARRPRRFDRSPLVRSLQAAVDDLNATIRRRQTRLEDPREPMPIGAGGWLSAGMWPGGDRDA
ncbi:hypothetical protein FOE78_01220 [Microlunatus elymi]|uniref:MinD-like ATPase involved in chromosome partitioning or flagellar assembly n=1 Tax=Microlunatus elymi TaxID=2596828 RepID=A0A516PU53_9ACTN|nr:hypothetical protein [Microlunatus elymi]QDP94718.1 hypothetical protein FOE78_01220 [Microlunatus elymi]